MSSVLTRKQNKEFKETIITDSTSSFSFGFKNVDKIFPENIELTPTKPIPDWLNITLYTLNPGRFDFDYTQQKELESVNKTFTIDHLFDVLPIIQKFVIDGKTNAQKVQYMSQSLCKGVERKIHENHSISDKVSGLWSRNINQSSFSRAVIQPLKFNKKAPKPENEIIADNITSQFPSKFHKGSIATLNSTGNIRFIDNNLKGEKVINYLDINNTFKTSYCSPHPIRDPFNGRMINVLAEIGLTFTKFKVIEFDEESSNIITEINAPISPIHSFAITENYIIVISFPYFLKRRGLSYFAGESIFSSFDYNLDGLTTFYVITKKENRHIATFSTNAYYGLHSINAYETNTTVWIDFCIYDNDNFVRNLTVENIRNATKLSIPSSRIIRFRLDINEVEMADTNVNPNNNVLSASFEHLSQDISIELPVINEKYIGRNYKYAYGVGLPFTDPTPGKYYDRIKKIDLEKEQYITWNEPHCYPSQPIFVPNPSNSDDEDEGVVMSSIYDGSKDESFILVLNAKDLTEITRIPLPVAVAPSFTPSTYIIN
jgi:carotenoid cleavage dioxygenase-like enzyme